MFPPITSVESPSIMEERGSPDNRWKPAVHRYTPRMSFSGPLAAALRNASFTSSAVTLRLRVTVKSTIDTTGTGTRREYPVSLPSREGMTLPSAFAAPLE